MPRLSRSYTQPMVWTERPEVYFLHRKFFQEASDWPLGWEGPLSGAVLLFSRAGSAPEVVEESSCQLTLLGVPLKLPCEPAVGADRCVPSEQLKRRQRHRITVDRICRTLSQT